LEPIAVGGEAIAIQAARNYHALRAQGITIRKSIDSLIATRCIDRNSDRGFRHLEFTRIDFHKVRMAGHVGMAG
jgi:hypothetical protein